MYTILLLDVDGVLIHARGYRASVRATVDYIAHRMGQHHIAPPSETDMLTFEAENIIFEWDSAALCVAALINQVPHLLKDTLEETLDHIVLADVTLEQPDYVALAHRVPKPARDDIKPGRAALGTLFPEHPVFVELLGNTHSVEAPITKIFQHYVLGDDQYARTYQQQPLFNTESMLEKFDYAILTDENRQRMLTTPNLYPVMYTARPSLPPGFVMNWRNYSPEAEIAQRLLELNPVPLIGYGRMQWLAAQQAVPSNTYVKPSHVHSLVGIYSAVLKGQKVREWEMQALQLAVSNDPIPDHMKSEPWQVMIFEDSYGSIEGAKKAVAQLSQQHEVTLKAVGIANDPAKVGALTKVADHVATDINAGLQWALNWQGA